MAETINPQDNNFTSFIRSYILGKTRAAPIENASNQFILMKTWSLLIGAKNPDQTA